MLDVIVVCGVWFSVCDVFDVCVVCGGVCVMCLKRGLFVL